MNKTAIKNFAIWARRKLISDITYKAGMLGISENGIAEPLPQSTKDLQFFDIGTKDYAEVSGVAIEQRNALVSVIRMKEESTDYKTAFRAVVEEVAYTWFNRLIAVRFMEVNDYLPSRIRVLSSESAGKLEPDFVTTSFETDLEYSAYEKDRVYQLKDENKLDELFRMLFIKQCNKLSEILPGLFEQISDYTELLLNISFTDKDGIVYHLTHDIAEDEFNVEKEGQVEIIGWMYQYYNTEPKDEVFALLKKNVKITKERIPAATQLFTPDWIVRYMVENSLGRLWVEGHPNENLKGNWKYYLEEAEQEPDVVVQLNKIREEYAKINPVDIKVIDPCMGSGHILVYAFDVLMQIYTSQGYVERDAAKSILINNLYGIDIDVRAYQLAYFAVMMKARQYNRKIFSEHIVPNLIAIRNPLNIPKSVLKRLGGLEPLGLRLVEDFEDAEEYGSILQVDYTEHDLQLMEMKLEEIDRMADYGDLLVQMESAECCNLLWPLVKQARLLSQKYDVVVTNPPYMNSSGMNSKLSEYASKKYPISKYDLFAIMMERCYSISRKMGLVGMITMESWMFRPSFENIRARLLSDYTLISLIHMPYLGKGRNSMEISFGTAAFIGACSRVVGYNARFDCIRYYELDSNLVPVSFPVVNERWVVMDPRSVLLIDGCPLGYWMSNKFYETFNLQVLKSIGSAKSGMQTGNNDLFLRLWFEVSNIRVGFDVFDANDCKTKNYKWLPETKGGEYRKWYGNNDYIVDFYNMGENIKSYDGTVRIRDISQYFHKGITWSHTSSKGFGARILPDGFMFNVESPAFFTNDNALFCVLGLLNSSFADRVFRLLNQTMSYQSVDIERIPFHESVLQNNEISMYVKQCVELSHADWDSFETSWDFKEHPFVWYSRGLWDVTRTMANMSYFYGSAPKVSCPLEICWLLWKGECNERFNKLKANEEDLNRIFIDIYGLQDELMPDVADKDVTVRKADIGKDMRSFVSYAVGCMLGRYSLDVKGLAYAGGTWDASKFSSFIPDSDNCIPITDEEYFADDIVGRFVEFVRVVYGPAKLEENLDFVAAALGNKGNTSREVIRNYFLNDFYKDHLKVYQKRPIYWLFDSGKQNGFKALVYMHRWNSDTVGNLRIEYLHKMQTVYEREIENCQDMIDHGSGRDVAAAVKRKEKLVKQLKECRDYDALVAHIAFSKVDINLDDGVKVNYRKVQTGADGKFCEILAASKDIMAKEK